MTVAASWGKAQLRLTQQGGSQHASHLSQVRDAAVRDGRRGRILLDVVKALFTAAEKVPRTKLRPGNH